MRYAKVFVKKVLHPVERAARWTIRPFRDALANRRYRTCPEQIVLVRHRVHITSYYRYLLDWMAAELPQVRPYFVLQTLPCHRLDWSRCRLVVPWVSENKTSRSPRMYQQLKELEARCDEHAIATINRVDCLLKALKLEASRLIAAAGVRTPKIDRIEDIDRFRRDLQGRQPPVLVRENRSHGGRTPSYLVRTVEEAARIPLERFEDPIASEYIDVRDAHDGYFRKYRYLAAGDVGVCVSLQIARHWEVRSRQREIAEATRREELSYQSRPDPNHARFQQVCRALGLDAVAFDYSYSRDGEPVVWEINVLPDLSLATEPEHLYINAGLRRGMASLIRLYLTRAGLRIPPLLDQILSTGQAPAKRAA